MNEPPRDIQQIVDVDSLDCTTTLSGREPITKEEALVSKDKLVEMYKIENPSEEELEIMCKYLGDVVEYNLLSDLKITGEYNE